MSFKRQNEHHPTIQKNKRQSASIEPRKKSIFDNILSNLNPLKPALKTNPMRIALQISHSGYT